MKGELWAVLTYLRTHTFDLLQQVPSPIWATSKLLSCRSVVFPGQTMAKDTLSCSVTLQRRGLLLQP